METFRSSVWGYGVLDPLLRDPEISDIKVYSAYHIRTKRVGAREDAPENVHFWTDEGYKAFVNQIAARNNVNLGTINSIQTFTDKTLPDWNLRISVMASVLMDCGLPLFHIRKLSKDKPDFSDLERDGMFSMRRTKRRKLNDRSIREMEEQGVTERNLRQYVEELAKAYERFMECMSKNFDANKIMQFGDELRLKRFVVYDVREDKVTITEYGPYGKTGQSVGNLGLVKAPNGVTIKETSAYAEISFMVKGLSDRQLEETDQCLRRLTHDYRPEP